MLIHVPLDQIDDNPFQRRQDYGDVETLAADIRQRGLLQIPRGRMLFDSRPMTAEKLAATLVATNGWPAGASFRVQLAFGHRRLRAYRHLAETQGGRWTAMPVYVEALDDDTMLDAVWSENQHRSDINPIEQAELLSAKLDRLRADGGNQATLAAAWGLDRSTIANKLRLLALPLEVQTAVRERRLSERQATALLPVLELETKLNGAAVAWGDTGGPTWHPRSPAGYIAEVIAKPDTATSDAIRNYTQIAVRHAGWPLGDAFAAFEAGPGRGIIQSACKGCPRRLNQTCLDAFCFNARDANYREAIPEWATAATGLPFSDDVDDFTLTYEERRSLDARYRAGDHTGLVVGIHLGYTETRPFSKETYVHTVRLHDDWKQVLAIGRSARLAVQEDAPLLPSESELKAWRENQKRANPGRTKRAKAALRSFAAGLLDNETGLRVLAAMNHGLEFREWQRQGHTPTAEQLLGLLFESSWGLADTTGYYSNDDPSNRTALRTLLLSAAIPPDIVDPPDPALRLLDIGQLTLLTYTNTRGREGPNEPHKRLGRLRDALAEFDAASVVVSASDELATLSTYLAAAVAREEQLLEVEIAKIAAAEVEATPEAS